MNNEIKEILDRLERIDHKENKTAFEFADSATFDEMARCFKERKMMADYITNLQEELEITQEKWNKDKQFSNCRTMEMLDYKSRNEKAIEYIKRLCYIESKNEWFDYGDDLSPEHIVNILNGDENE